MSYGFVCFPRDAGLYSIAFRLHAGFFSLQGALLTVGAVDLLTVGVLVGGVRAPADPKKLRYLRTWAVATACTATLPFMSAALVVGGVALIKLTRCAWVANAHLLRDTICSFVLFLLGVGVATSPALAAALASYRAALASEGQDLDSRQLRKWATVAATPLAAQLAWLMWEFGAGPIESYVARLWAPPAFDDSLLEMVVACFLMLALPAVTIAAVVVPARAATQSIRLRKPRVPSFDEPSRFVLAQN